uniref:Putative dynein arm light chain, axonemal n=1 Tax=Trypanosoma congolense (strain IL3000) TaxID=1068625 RepID=G0UPD4_TRYCI|nr:putative dynein arm light chain, axonemal [Trypanosoma congolense IL3000]
MSHVNIQSNVYDEKGTVLYRAILSDLKDGDEAANIASTVAAVGTASCEAPGARSVGWREIHEKHGCTAVKRDKIDVEGESARLTQESLTSLTALDKLFPPVPLSLSQHGEDGSPITNALDREQRQGHERVWMRVAATDHTSRLDCVHLQEHLERRCQQEHARPTGVVCAIREGIYAEGMQEVIRQVTVLCPERGLLLAELAEEMQQTTNTYDILFDSASQYAVRKAIERDLRSYLFDEKEWMESEVRRLENRVNELRAKHNGLLKRFEEQKQSEQKIHEEEMKYLRKANQQIVNEIKRLSALEKSNVPAMRIEG